jgi:hypothetical protein
VHQADGGVEALNAALDQLQVRIVTEAHRVESLGLGSADIARGGSAGWVGILVEADQRVPVLVAGALHCLANLFPRQRHLTARGGVPNS